MDEKTGVENTQIDENNIMLTLKELDLLLSKPLRKAVKDNISSDPAKIALDKNIPHAKLIATQVKYLQKARKKLPSFYKAQCIISPKAYEQCSSEAAASHRHYKGEFCLDMGSGLGVDSYYLSKRFDRIISIERDPLLSEIARVNLELLGSKNISVAKMDIEEALIEYPTLSADMVFIDPDRRGADGKKKVTLEDCSPNVAEIMPKLKMMAPKIVIKLSPMFDIDEAFRIFGEHVITDVVSVDGECKEVLVEVDDSIASPVIKASGVGDYEVEYPYCKEPVAITPPPSSLSEFRYLIVPDVALSKARIAKKYFTDAGAYIETDNSYAFSDTRPKDKVGKIFEIESVEKYSPKNLRQKLAGMKIKKINVMKHEFPYSTDKITKELGVSEGGTQYLAFTSVAGKRWAVFLK